MTYEDYEGIPSQATCDICTRTYDSFCLQWNPETQVKECTNCIIKAKALPSNEPMVSWDDVRGLRNSIIAQSDWTALSDVPSETALPWASFRESLRNVTVAFEDASEAFEWLIEQQTWKPDTSPT